MLKITILVLVMALLVSLGSGFYYLMSDQGDKSKRRTLNSLGVRLGIGLTLAAVIVYGIATDRLGNRTPWDPGPKQSTSPEP